MKGFSMAGLKSAAIIGLALAAGFAAGWSLAPPPGPARPQPEAVVTETSGDMSGDILARVDAENPAAVDLAFVQAMIPFQEQAAMAAEQVIRHGEDEDLRGLAETIARTRQGEAEWLRGWMRSHPGTDRANADAL